MVNNYKTADSHRVSYTHNYVFLGSLTDRADITKFYGKIW